MIVNTSNKNKIINDDQLEEFKKKIQQLNTSDVKSHLRL